MKLYEVYLTEDRFITVSADSTYCSGAGVWFFASIDNKRETVAVFNLENIFGYRLVLENT